MTLLNRPFRMIRGGLLCALIILVAHASLTAQFKFRDPAGRKKPDALVVEDGNSLWERFMRNRAAGTFRMEGELVHRPAREPSRRFTFTLTADWKERCEVTRVAIAKDGTLQADEELRQCHGSNKLIDYSKGKPDCRNLSQGEWDILILDSLPFTWNDLMMPFLQWSDFTYLGPVRHLGRPAHRFELLAPVPDAFPAKAVVTIDEDYAALLRADLYDAESVLVRRLRIGGFKRFGEEWMFSELNWEERRDRSSTRLVVDSFTRSPEM